MEILYKELTEAQIIDGIIKSPSIEMRRAAKYIKQMLEMWEADKNGRLAAEMRLGQAYSEIATQRHEREALYSNLNLLQDLITSVSKECDDWKLKYRALLPVDLNEYKEVMNRDRE